MGIENIQCKILCMHVVDHGINYSVFEKLF